MHRRRRTHIEEVETVGTGQTATWELKEDQETLVQVPETADNLYPGQRHRV
jgi:hypothetical protein